MPNTRVPADGEAMPAASPTFITPQAGAVVLACVALHRHRVALDNLRYRAEAEIVEYARARKDMEILISRLIDKLDEADGDPDLEPYLGRLSPGYLDEAEEQNEHGSDDDREGDILDLGELDLSDYEPELDGEGAPEWQAEVRTKVLERECAR